MHKLTQAHEIKISDGFVRCLSRFRKRVIWLGITHDKTTGISTVDEQYVRVQFEKFVVFVSWQTAVIRDSEMFASITPQSVNQVCQMKCLVLIDIGSF